MRMTTVFSLFHDNRIYKQTYIEQQIVHFYSPSNYTSAQSAVLSKVDRQGICSEIFLRLSFI